MNNILKPLDLNAESVKNIYLACRPTSETKELYRIIFQQKALGFPDDSTPLLLDAKAVETNLSNIFYLFGQLKSIHLQYPFLPIKDILKKYDNTFWTKDKSAPMYLMHLGIAAGAMMPPTAETKSAFVGNDILPTLSPNDPDFQNWYENNKVKLLRKRPGIEPADD